MKTIAILGSAASFHEIAAQHYFNAPTNVISCTSPQEVLHQIKNNPNCDGGILAVENTLAGLVTKHYNSLQQAGIKICGELMLKIQHQLVALPGTYLHDIWEIRTHPMAIKQCGNYLNRIHPSTRLLEWSDTASAAREIASNNLEGVAAIASELAAKKYNLEIIAPNIHNNQHNYTRFLILSKIGQSVQVQHNKATLTFRLNHRIGSLSKVLLCLEAAKINLTKLHSFPLLEQSGDYEFIADIEFDNLQTFEQLQAQLPKITKAFQILGTYQKAPLSSLLEPIKN